MEDSAFIDAPSELARINTQSTKLGFTMASEPRTGSLLQVLAASKPGGRLLELGTGTGVATAWLLSGMDAAASLTSVDVNAEFQAVAREVLGRDRRLNLVLEDGVTFIRRQPKHSYDLIFADAVPGKYEALDETLALVKPGGLYVIDDMLPQPNWPEGHDQKALALMHQLSSIRHFHMSPLVWATGIVVMVRRPPLKIAAER